LSYFKKFTQKQIRMAILIVVIILSTIIFADVVEDVFSDPINGESETLVHDKQILKTLQEFRGPELNQSMVDITALGSFSVITLLTSILVIFLLTLKDWRGLFYIFCINVGTILIPNFLKGYFMRDRPDLIGQIAYAKHSSFPSGHSFGATVAYFSLAFLLTRELKVLKLEALYYLLAILVVGLVGTSRMYLGVHFPTDVIGGICCGLIWFSIITLPFIYYNKQKDSV
jgi:undecaprenyl-diphosphatase